MTDVSAVSHCAGTTLAVLAGGEGSRMGGPKGVLALERRPILERLLDRLDWRGPTLLVTAPGREHPPGWQRFTCEATDPVAGQGPLRGILTALEHAPTNQVVVLPVDMPNVTLPPLAWLAVMFERHGRIEPLPAVFHARNAQYLLRAHLADGRLALHRLTESPEVVVVPESPDWPADFWVNLNTRSDLAAYSAGVISD